jgi:hypothetical protein
MPFGFMDTTFIDFPANVDVAYIQGLQNREGITFQEIIGEIDTRLGVLAGAIDPLLADLITVTTEPTADDTAPVAFTIEERSERTIARPQLAEESAHMLPIKGYDVALGFTEDFLMNAPRRRVLNQVDSVVAGLRHLYRKLILTRLTSDAEIGVDKKTSATSPGFAGSGSGSNVFSRPFPNGSALTGGYTQYYRAATSARDVTLKAMRDQLALWQEPPFDLIGSASEIAAISLLPDFVSAGSVLVRPAQTVAEALLNPDTYVGVYDKNIRVRKPVLDWTSANVVMFKSFGALNPANPLAWRYDPQRGRNAFVRFRSLFPLDNAVILQDLGIGVNNRVAAALAYFAASGNYTPPTIA